MRAIEVSWRQIKTRTTLLDDGGTRLEVFDDEGRPVPNPSPEQLDQLEELYAYLRAQHAKSEP